ncbi:MAG: HTTM domain-containing protein [Myxococcales bacterium]|nr:HTTM domain-containing protein [Myxococcales bacterium]
MAPRENAVFEAEGGAVSSRGTASIDVLGAFSVLLAITALTHRTIPNWTRAPTGHLSVIMALALLWKPTSTRRFGLFVVIMIVEWLRQLPFVPNHFFFEGLVYVSLLLTLARRAWLDRGSAIQRDRLFRDLAPLIRVELCVLYFFAVFHKLNTDFFNPDVSCAVQMHQDVAGELLLIPSGRWTDFPVIAATLLFEALIPVLLMLRGTVRFGVLAGLFFHWLLAVHPHPGIYSFTAMMFALYFPFLAADTQGELGAMWERALGRFRRVKLLGKVHPVFWIVLLMLSSVAVMMRVMQASTSFKEGVWATGQVGFYTWVPAGVFVTLSYLLALRRTWAARRARSPLSLQPAWLLVPVMLANGFLPDFGLKTLTVWSMFSNLRTEYRSNHMLMPQVPLTDLQTDHVEIIHSNNHGTVEECDPVPTLGQWCSYTGQKIPMFEFRRWVSTHRNEDGSQLEVEYVYRGQRYQIGSDGDPELTRRMRKPHPLWLGKLMFLRQVQDENRPAPCGW